MFENELLRMAKADKTYKMLPLQEDLDQWQSLAEWLGRDRAGGPGVNIRITEIIVKHLNNDYDLSRKGFKFTRQVLLDGTDGFKP